jgi:hypothetical protein
VGLRVLGIECQRLAKLRDGFVEAGFPQQRQPQIVLIGGIVRIELRCPPQARQGFIDTAFLQGGNALGLQCPSQVFAQTSRNWSFPKHPRCHLAFRGFVALLNPQSPARAAICW